MGTSSVAISKATIAGSTTSLSLTSSHNKPTITTATSRTRHAKAAAVSSNGGIRVVELEALDCPVNSEALV